VGVGGLVPIGYGACTTPACCCVLGAVWLGWSHVRGWPAPMGADWLGLWEPNSSWCVCQMWLWVRRQHPQWPPDGAVGLLLPLPAALPAADCTACDLACSLKACQYLSSKGGNGATGCYQIRLHHSTVRPSSQEAAGSELARLCCSSHLQ
jgi:hypothetical protein